MENPPATWLKNMIGKIGFRSQAKEAKAVEKTLKILETSVRPNIQPSPCRKQTHQDLYRLAEYVNPASEF